MKIVFNGIIEKRSKGCNCKRTSNTDYGFTPTKMYILPSGAERTFTVGREETVSELDGNFLLSYSYVDANGSKRDVFTRVV